MMRPHLALLASISLGSLAGCAPPTEPSDAPGEGEGEGPPATNPGVVLDSTESYPIDANIVVGVALAVRPDGRWAVVYAFRSEAPEVDCVTFGAGEPPTVPQNDIFVMDEQDGSAPRVRLVDTVPDQPGNSLDIVADPVSGALLVAYTGGGIATGSCQASDLVVAVENGATFTVQSVAANSGDGGTDCRDPSDPICALGDVTGRFPALAARDGSIAVSYLDTHFGYTNTDIFGSDLELGLGAPGAPALATLNDSSGAGNYSNVAYLPDGRVVVGHGVIASNDFPDENGGTYTVPEGIYVVTEQLDGTFLSTMVQTQSHTDGRVAVAASATSIYAAFHDDNGGAVVLWTSTDDGATFTPGELETGQAKSGTDPGLGVFSDGTIIAVYGHCANSIASDGCVTAQDGVRVSTRRPQDPSFLKQVFKGDDEDTDGKNADFVLLPDDTFVTLSVTFPITAANSSSRTVVIQRFSRAP